MANIEIVRVIIRAKKRSRAALVASAAVILVAVLAACALGAGSESGTDSTMRDDTADKSGSELAPEYTDVNTFPEHGIVFAFPFDYGESLEVVFVEPDESIPHFEISAPQLGIGVVARVDTYHVAQSFRQSYEQMGEPFAHIGANNVYDFYLVQATDLPLPGTDDPRFTEASAAFESIRDSFDSGLYAFTLCNVGPVSDNESPAAPPVPERAPPLDVDLSGGDRTQPQSVRAAQLTNSWNIVDANGNGFGYVADSVHPLQMQDYSAVTLEINNERARITLRFGDYAPQSVRVQRWNATYAGTEDMNILIGGEPIAADKTGFDVGDDGNDYIYEVYATWPEGESVYAFRIDSLGKKPVPRPDLTYTGALSQKPLELTRLR